MSEQEFDSLTELLEEERIYNYWMYDEKRSLQQVFLNTDGI